MMVKFVKNNIKVCIETEPVGDSVKFHITMPIVEPGVVVQAFKLAGFKVNDYDMCNKNVRFTCMPINPYEEAEKMYSVFVGTLCKNGFKIVKQKKRRYTRDEIFKMFA